jgi:hypothetical protein
MFGPAKTLNRTRLIGFVAMGVCVVGYSGMGLALLLGKLGHMDMIQAAIWAAVAGIIGEIGLWVGAACLGLTLFKKRTAMLNRLFGRGKAVSKV